MKTTLTTLTALLLTGCVTVPKTYEVVEGSKATGKLILGYEIVGSQKAQVEENQAHEEALRRCRNWGYADAEGFAPRKAYVGREPVWGRWRYMVTREFQCL